MYFTIFRLGKPNTLETVLQNTPMFQIISNILDNDMGELLVFIAGRYPDPVKKYTEPMGAVNVNASHSNSASSSRPMLVPWVL